MLLFPILFFQQLIFRSFDKFLLQNFNFGSILNVSQACFICKKILSKFFGFLIRKYLKVVSLINKKMIKEKYLEKNDEKKK